VDDYANIGATTVGGTRHASRPYRPRIGTRRPVRCAGLDERYLLDALPWDPSALEPQCQAEMVTVHHEQHHAAQVDRANRALQQLDDARQRGDWPLVELLETELAVALSEHVLHSIFWSSLGPARGDEPTGALRAALEEGFGNLGTFRDRFMNAAAAVHGDGWTALAWDGVGRRLVIEPVNDHRSIAIRSTHLLLVCDVWNHAYAMQFGQARAAWVAAFWEIIDWCNVERRLIAQFGELIFEPYTSALSGCGMPI
jgi:superoxide dismutase, Fe-Mn family